jgi:hypothetical protein
VVISDANATDFVGRTPVPIFRDASAGLAAWREFEPAGVTKHDTFVYDRTGRRTLFWDAGTKNLANWAADMRVAVEAIGRP